jgi:hypothetical protein
MGSHQPMSGGRAFGITDQLDYSRVSGVNFHNGGSTGKLAYFRTDLVTAGWQCQMEGVTSENGGPSHFHSLLPDDHHSGLMIGKEALSWPGTHKQPNAAGHMTLATRRIHTTLAIRRTASGDYDRGH